jgi:mRNA-degrading endonuclease RelE of RelBE toxin-antitoxin system
MALMTDAPSVQILVTPDFQGQLRKLAKRYRNIRSDLQPLFDDLERGNCPGDQIPGSTYCSVKLNF